MEKIEVLLGIVIEDTLDVRILAPRYELTP